MTPVPCVARDGSRHTFYFEVTDDLTIPEWYVDVHDVPNAALPSGMQLMLCEYDTNTLMICTATVSRRGFEGNGIRDAVIPLLRGVLKKMICSSSHEHPKYPNEDRNKSGSAVWERLTRCGRARYDPALDRYFLL